MKETISRVTYDVMFAYSTHGLSQFLFLDLFNPKLFGRTAGLYATVQGFDFISFC